MCSCWRNLVSMRFRVATCALKARLTTEMLSMNAISGTNASSSVAPANGPPPANVPQAAKPERMSTAVAVSRPPHENRRDHERTRRVAKPPCGAYGDEVPPVDLSGEVEAAGSDDRADHRAGSEGDHGEFRDCGCRIEGFAALRPGID